MQPDIAGRPLLRILGLGFGVAVGMGGAVGQGIFRTPGLVADALQIPWLILAVWCLGGIIALIDSCAVAELATSVPKAGGPYSFADRAFGPLGGTLVGWADLFTNVAATAFVTFVFGETVQRLGFLQGIPTGAIAVMLIFGCWVITWHGTRSSGFSQNLLNAAKGAGLLALILAFFLYVGEPAEASEAPGTLLGVGAFATAMRAIQNTYSGWHSAVYFSEEIDAPAKNLSRALFIGIGLIAFIYVMMNAALLSLMPVSAIAASTFPAADAADIVFGPMGGTVLSLFAILSFTAITQLNLLSNSRICYALARNGYIPARFAQVAEKGSPRPALLACTLAPALLVMTGSYETLIAIGVSFSTFIYASMDLSAIRLRQLEPDLPRPFRMPLFPLPAVIGLLVNVALMLAFVIEAPIPSLSGLGLVLTLATLHWYRHRAKVQPAL